VFNLASARCKYISLPIALDQSTQLVPGGSSDNGCHDSLLYKGSEDDDELGLEVTGWVWNKRTKTKTMMTATRIRVKGSMVAVRLRLWGVDKRTV
jgi:hypothetical protein